MKEIKKILAMMLENNNKLSKERKTTILIIIVAILVITLGFGYKHITNKKSEEKIAQLETTLEDKTESSKEEEFYDNKIVVDICGEVKKPMVIELKENSRVEDAINAAGGITSKADLEDINRAAILTDGEKIYIPSIDLENKEASKKSDGYTTDGKININKANKEQLQEITGVGVVTATKIVDYREEKGPYKKLEDLKEVSGIGDKTFEKIKEQISIK